MDHSDLFQLPYWLARKIFTKRWFMRLGQRSKWIPSMMVYLGGISRKTVWRWTKGIR